MTNSTIDHKKKRLLQTHFLFFNSYRKEKLMKIGLDFIPLMQLLELDILGFMEKANELGYEGVMLPSGKLIADDDYRQEVIKKKNELGLYVEMGGSGIDASMSGRKPEELAESWKAFFDAALEMDVNVLLTGLGTWPWEGRIISKPGKSLRNQIEGGIATLKQVSKMAEDNHIAVTIHTAFFTADEYVEIMEAVDSPFVGLCLDTANSFLVMEDPVEFARKTAPWVKSTHLKDSCIYMHGDKMHWMGGCPLGRGTVDLPVILDMLYKANPDLNLSIEDHWGRSPVPIYNEEYMNSFANWNGLRIINLLKHLQKGESLIKAGMHLTDDRINSLDWKRVMPERAVYNRIYLKKLRDEIESDCYPCKSKDTKP
ncbi:TIM barrel protein [Candidatus Poribacteria bacterium]|nr:TIM barrel protein [Candidatus Poribacteria bacterium]